MLSLSDNNQPDIIEAFNSTSRYLDDLINIDNPYFEQMVCQIYPTELHFNKANSSDTEALILDLNLSITNGIASLPMVYIFLSLFVLLECGLMLMNSTTETYF